MSYYIVKHGSNDWRTHLEDGTELATYASEPTMAEAYADVAEYLGLSARQQPPSVNYSRV